MPLTLSQINAALRPIEPDARPLPVAGVRRRAAVAAIVRERPGGLDVLLMQRAANPRDPWSGDVCLPGGHRDESDESLLATAIRETREEVGLDLEVEASVLGMLEPVRPFGRLGRLVVHPFVFVLRADARLRLGVEAVDAFWLPLERAMSGGLDGRYVLWLGPVPLSFACWRYENRVVWGLTLRMLCELLRG